MAADRKRKRTTSANRPRSSRNTRSGGSFRVPTARVGSPLVRHRLLLALIMAAVMALSGRLIWVQGLDASARAEEAQRDITVQTAMLEARRLAGCAGLSSPPRLPRAPGRNARSGLVLHMLG